MGERCNSDFAQAHLTAKEEEKKPELWCEGCWLLRKYCVCPTIQEIKPGLTLGPNRLLVYMHYKEYKRSSNSAILLQKLLCDETKLVIFGTEEGKTEFGREIADDSLRTCVLFPCATSVPITEWMAQRPGLPIRLIALDGTWTQCKKMSKSLPKSLSLVHLNPDAPSRFRSRKQTSGNRLSTLEAVALAWKLLGVEVMDGLMRAFDAKDRAGMCQKHRDYELSD
jgi:DTW domain-containing protein YfiP